jgi:hypothetical protein
LILSRCSLMIAVCGWQMAGYRVRF